MIIDSEETIAATMTRIETGDTSGLEIFDMVDGRTLADLKLAANGLVCYSVLQGGIGATSKEGFERQLRSGSLIVSGGPADSRPASKDLGWKDLYDLSFDALQAAQSPVAFPGPADKVDNLLKIAALISAQRGDPLDDAALERLAAAGDTGVRDAVARLASDPGYRMEEFRQDNALHP